MVLIVLVLLVSGIFNYKMVAVASDSMRPIFKRGDAVVYEKIEDAKDIDEGTVIAFYNDGILVTHRIIDKSVLNGTSVYKTKGDNNNAPDNYFVKADDIVGIVKYKISYLGYPTVWLTEKMQKKG